jgi:DNA-binding transcriptional ArsR family regulator
MFDAHRTYLFDDCQTMNSAAHSADPRSASDGADILSVLQALSDPVRLEIVRQLAGGESPGELTCGQLQLPVTKSTCSHHLKVLSGAGVIAEREVGTRKFITLRRADLDRRFPGLLDSVLHGAAAVASRG